MIVAASNGRLFEQMEFDEEVRCVWASGARTLHNNPQKILKNLIRNADAFNTKTIVTYCDIALNSLPAAHRPCTRHLEQSPEKVAQCFLELQSNLNRKGIQMISMLGKRLALAGEPEIYLKEAFLAKDIRFFRADKTAEHKFAFEKDDVHVKPSTFKKCIDGVVRMAKTGYNAGRDRRRCRNKGS